MSGPRKDANKSARVLLGAIAGAHGVRGEFRVKTFTAAPENIAAYGPLETEDGRAVVLKIVRILKGDLVIARSPAVSTREAAEALRGTRLYAARAALPAPDEDEFYYEDLVGLEAVDERGGALGRVVAVHDFGAGDLIEIGGAGRARMIPFTRAAVPAVDLSAGRLVIAEAALSEGDGAAPRLSDATGELVSDDFDAALAAMREEDA